MEWLSLGVLHTSFVRSGFVATGIDPDQSTISRALSAVAPVFGEGSSGLCPGAGGSQRSLDVLVCDEGLSRINGVCPAGACDGNDGAVWVARGRETEICESSFMDVAMFSVVRLGRHAKVDGRIGAGHRHRRRLGVSAVGLDQLAAAVDRF